MNNLIYVYITNSSMEEARLLARALLQKRLIACANFFPIKSMYWWEGKIDESDEVVMIAKTHPDQYESVRRAVAEIHPYKIPCIVRIDAFANEPYFAWLQESLRGQEIDREQMGPAGIED